MIGLVIACVWAASCFVTGFLFGMHVQHTWHDGVERRRQGDGTDTPRALRARGHSPIKVIVHAHSDAEAADILARGIIPPPVDTVL